MNEPTFETSFEQEYLVDVSAENAVLGAILIDPDGMQQAAEMGLTPEMFWWADNQAIFQAQHTLWQIGQPIDFVTLSDQLQTIQADESAQLQVLQLLNATPNAFNLAHYARIVLKRYKTRLAVSSAQGIIKKAMAQEHPDVILDYAMQQINQISGLTQSDNLMAWSDSFGYTQGLLEGYHSAPDQALTGITTPWPAINSLMTGGLQPGGIMVFGAPTSTGKTIIAECIADHLAFQGYHVGFAHPELNKQTMINRRTCRWTGLSLDRVMTNQPRQAEVNAIYHHLNLWRNVPGAVDYLHCPGFSMDEILVHAKLKQWQVLIIDYLQLIRPSADQWRMNEEMRLANDVAKVKIWAEQNGTCALILSQLSRFIGGFQGMGEDKLRGSGRIGEQASFVWLGHRNDAGDDPPIHDEAGNVMAIAGEKSPLMRCKVTKNTMGPTTDKIRLLVDGARFRVEEI